MLNPSLCMRKKENYIGYLLCCYLLYFYITGVKPGYCPAVDADQVGICVNECTGDYDCSGTDKCCGNGCGNTCQRARSKYKIPLTLSSFDTLPKVMAGQRS